MLIRTDNKPHTDVSVACRKKCCHFSIQVWILEFFNDMYSTKLHCPVTKEENLYNNWARARYKFLLKKKKKLAFKKRGENIVRILNLQMNNSYTTK